MNIFITGGAGYIGSQLAKFLIAKNYKVKIFDNLSFVFAIEQKNNMKKNIYNVGDNSLNFSKEDICKKIQNLLPNVYVNYADIGTDLDKRNYSVSFDKINNLGFKTSFTIEHGMRKLLKIYKFIELNSKYKNV